MGDCGSLALGGFLGAISLLTFNALYLLVLGVMFVLSIVSVIVQVLYYKRTKKRVFLMAPYHHHLQMKGLTESKISFIYSVITCIIGLTIIISYL
jgi:phospho-N-acetylmuramoyl-pentapeptide-transferase